MANPEGVNDLVSDAIMATLAALEAASDAELSDEGKTELPDDDEPQRPRVVSGTSANDRLKYIIELEHELNAKSRRLYDTQCLVAAMLRKVGETRVPKEFIAEADPSRVSIISGFDGADVVFRLKEADEA